MVWHLEVLTDYGHMVIAAEGPIFHWNGCLVCFLLIWLSAIYSYQDDSDKSVFHTVGQIDN